MKQRGSEIVKAERDGIWSPWPWERRSREQLLMEYGSAIRKYVGLPPAWEVEDHPVINIQRNPVKVPHGQARLAQELWQEVVEWCGKGPQSIFQALGRLWRSFQNGRDG